MLALTNIVNNHPGPVNYVVTRSVEIAVVLALGWRWGLDRDDLGLARSNLARGLLRAAGAIVAVGAGYTAVPLIRSGLPHSLTAAHLRGAAVDGATRVLLGTVLLDELTFRGVLCAMPNHLHGPRTATLSSAVLFGPWHILPALGTRAGNVTLPQLAAGWPVGVTVTLTVAFTTAAGIVLAWLREHTGSLLAPIGLHWAANGYGPIFVALASAAQGAGPPRRASARLRAVRMNAPTGPARRPVASPHDVASVRGFRALAERRCARCRGIDPPAPTAILLRFASPSTGSAASRAARIANHSRSTSSSCACPG
jgi:membrane protease YdiL (CAAX protease family)